MSLRGLLPAWLRKPGRVPGYDIKDPQPVQAGARYTFYLPTKAAIDKVGPGSVVKLLFEAVPPSDDYGGERMWVRVTARNGDTIQGTLDNDPCDIPALTSGAQLDFPAAFIIDILDDDSPPSGLDQWLVRCFADNAVLDGRARVGYLYREPPEHEPDDTFPDSGWRIRAEDGQISKQENEAAGFSYIAIGKVLNQDDSILPLLDAPESSRFQRQPDGSFKAIKDT